MTSMDGTIIPEKTLVEGLKRYNFLNVKRLYDEHCLRLPLIKMIMKVDVLYRY